MMEVSPSRRSNRSTVLVTNIPVQATAEQVQQHMSQAGLVQSVSKLYRSSGSFGTYLYCHYRFPDDATHAILYLNRQPFLDGHPHVQRSFLQPPPPGTEQIPLASLLPSDHISPLPIIHPPTPPPVSRSHTPPPTLTAAQPMIPPPIEHESAFSVVPSPVAVRSSTAGPAAHPTQPLHFHPLPGPVTIPPPHNPFNPTPVYNPPHPQHPIPSYPTIPPPLLPTGYIQPPRISVFMGDSNKGHGVDFDSWKFEVESLLRDATYSERVLAPFVRQSIRGEPSRLIQTLGPHASIHQLIHELEASYGTVQDGPALLQKAYNSHQEDQESAAAFGRRLKLLTYDACRRGGLPQSSMDTVLRQIYWRGLRDPEVRNACRHLKDTAGDFDHLVRLVRKGEQEVQATSCRPPKDHRPPHPVVPVPATTPQPFSEALSNINSTLAELKVALRPTANNASSPKHTAVPKPNTNPPPVRQQPVECFRCGEKGHISKGCRNPPKPKTNGTTPQAPLNTPLSPQRGMWQAAEPRPQMTSATQTA